ncbi:MAG: HAMP domain-containing histidine kinase [Ruminococcus sp.]|nr:HAMP domain-containing histidine kinase [Ruminococcus sp.]
MKSFRKLFTTVFAIIIATFIGTNLFLINTNKDDNSRPYRVEASRIAQEIESGNYSTDSLKKYDYITDVELLTVSNSDVFYKSDSDYLIKVINGDTYRFDYTYSSENSDNIMVLNICLLVVALTVIILLIILRNKIIKPFEKIREVPFELAKGNLSVPLKESKGKYFGRFVWGLDLLREKLEEQKANELKLQKEKKTLVLSLSHDIKTPLGIIELYSKALEKGLYNDEEKKKQIAFSINDKCDEIKGYVDGIIKVSNEDFLNLDVGSGEFYLSEIIKTINTFYTDKLDLLKIDFEIEKFTDCILCGDVNRAVEVLQNIIENAIKYGDGKRIDISFAKEEYCQLIKIRNSGCTLSQNELPHIFDSFWRGSNVGSNSGSGLGLYICRQLMLKMNGDIFAEIKDGNMIVSAVFPIA